MILEVEDQGRVERIALVGAIPDKQAGDRTFIGGYRLNASRYGSIWFDRAVWDVTSIPNEDNIQTYRLTRKAV